MGLLLSSSYYQSKYNEVQTKIDSEINLAGVREADEGGSKLYLDKRLEALMKLQDYYESLYNEALSNEQGINNPSTTWYLERRENGY